MQFIVVSLGPRRSKGRPGETHNPPVSEHDGIGQPKIKLFINGGSHEHNGGEMKREIQVAIVVGVFLSTAFLSACTGGGTPAAPSTVTATSRVTVTQTATQPATTAPVTTRAATTPPVETTSARSAPAESWTMPNEIGRNLQRAQDDLQALTGNPMFISTSQDLTGKGRRQINDRNWQVCSSSPAPGAAFTSQTNVVFGVVRDSERCP